MKGTEAGRRRSIGDPRSGPFQAYADEFQDVLGGAPRLVKVVETDAHEGVVYVSGEDALYFTTLPAPPSGSDTGPPSVAIKRLALDGDRFPLGNERISVVRQPANMANGMTLDASGALVICEQGGPLEPARIARCDLATGKLESLVDAWKRLPLNSPNDVVVKSDGTVWFTDPSYGYLQGFRPEPKLGDRVYRYNPATGQLAVVADSFNKPNGLAFSPDESVLYITDSGANQEPDTFYEELPHHVRAFDVKEGGHLENDRLFRVTSPGFPDGIKVDAEGRVYTSAFSGVQVSNTLGDLIGEIRLPGAVNFTFGGPGNHILFIAANHAVWAASLAATGVAERRPV